MTRAAVLGATGHIGAHIVRALLAEGHEVVAAYRRPEYLRVLEGLPIRRVRIDLDEPATLPGALEGCAWVFHAAAFYPSFTARLRESLARGVTSIRRQLAALREAAPERVIFTSSAATIQRVPGRLATEADAEPWPLTSPRAIYATVKIAQEAEVRRACDEGLPAVIVNPTVCLGEHDAHSFSGRAILAFAKHRLPFYLQNQLNAVYTGDVGIGHVRAASRGRLGERYLLTGENLSIQQLAGMVCDAAGLPPPRILVPYPVAWTAALALELAALATGRAPLLTRQVIASGRIGQRVDGSKAIRELGMPHTPVAEAIRRALAWFRAQGMAP